MKSNECRVCGGEGKPSKGIVNYHNIRTSDKSKEFFNKIQDCTKCCSCGHSWIPLEKTPIEILVDIKNIYDNYKNNPVSLPRSLESIMDDMNNSN